ncbi:MAG: acyl-CoA carboxylase subunit beta [Alphaproteobacteria bacterium]|nr:acyl-CoA carboxylase subunit beta [Alphaproteobacteria bacterium]
MAKLKELLSDLIKRREVAFWGGGLDKAEARHAKGQMTARERLLTLFADHTFQEMGMHVEHDTREFGMQDKKLPGDGVVTGVGYVDGRPVASFSQDFTVAGGSLGKVHADKICSVMDYAGRAGMPIVGFNDSGGARIQEGVESLAGYGRVFYHNVLMSGVVPQIAVIAGPCAGGAAYSPALMDFIIMTRQNAHMFICGPDVIKAATGQSTTMDEIGSAVAHATVSGNIHFIADDDHHAIEIVRRLLSFLPANNVVDPPHNSSDELVLEDDHDMDGLVPESPKDPIDVHNVIAKLVDGADFLEVQKEFAKNIVVGFARIGGIVVGIIANQPKVKAGTLDIDASDKGARFIRFCNCFNVPIVTLVDVPGFLPGVTQELGGIIRHGAKMLFAYGATTVPKITVFMRKAYGGAYLAMCSRDMGADLAFAWPTAEIAVMGAEGAVNILYRRELAAAPNARELQQQLVADYRAKFSSPYLSAAKGLITDIIEPSRTRAAVALGLRSLLSKRETRPTKKHGNIPL